MRIDPELAGTIAAVVDEGTLEAAARRLQITPSAVSQRVKTLEQQLGRVLLVRSKPARPTEAGEAVVRLARQVALLEHDTITAFGLDANAEEPDADASTGRIRVPLAVNADSMATWFLAPLARLAAEHRIDVDLHRDDQNFTAGLLASGAVMAAVTSQAEPVGGCSATPLGVLEYEAAATPEFVARWFPDGVHPEALRDAPFVNFDRRDELQHDWLRGHGVDPWAVPRHYVPASHDFALAVRMGLGWGLLPTIQQTAGAQAVPLGGPRVRVPLYWQQWNLRSPLLDAIAAAVREEAGKMLAPL